MTHEVSPSEMPFPKYESYLSQARQLVDDATAAGSPLDFDTAMRHVQTFDSAMSKRVLPLFPGEETLTDMDSAEVFQLADTLDVLMTYANYKKRLAAAALAGSLYQSLPYSAVSQKPLILDRVLGVASSSVETIPEQLAHRYFSGETEEEQRRIAENIAEISGMASARSGDS